jgi:hypothetical protein
MAEGANMSAIERRLANLEAAMTPERRMVFVWRNADETPKQAIDRFLTERPDDARARLVVVGWQHPAAADCVGTA